MRLFGGERITHMMNTLKVDEDMPIQSKMLSNVIESSQKKVEGRNFGIRKNVLNYDDVMNSQREIIYKQRSQVLEGDDIHADIIKMIKDFIVNTVNVYIVEEDVHDNWNLDGLRDFLMGLFTTEEDFRYDPVELDRVTKQEIIDELTERALKKYEQREKELTPKILREVERVVLLKVVDTKWMNHIDDMEELKRGIGLRAYGNKNPVVEYRIEGFDMFDEMIASICEETVRMMYTVKVKTNDEPKREQVLKANPVKADNSLSGARTVKKKPGRNDPCPCGSGKKYKKCCGRNE